MRQTIAPLSGRGRQNRRGESRQRSIQLDHVVRRGQPVLWSCEHQIEACGIDAADIVVVGDGRDDQAAAREVGCRFVAVTDQPNAPLENVGTSIPDLRGLPDVLGLSEPAEGLKR